MNIYNPLNIKLYIPLAGGAISSDNSFNTIVIPFFNNLTEPIELHSKDIQQQYTKYMGQLQNKSEPRNVKDVYPKYNASIENGDILFTENKFFSIYSPERWSDIDDIALHKKYNCEDNRSQIVDYKNQFLYGYNNITENCPVLRKVRLNKSQSEQFTKLLPHKHLPTKTETISGISRKDLVNELFIQSNLSSAISEMNEDIIIHVSKIKFQNPQSHYENFSEYISEMDILEKDISSFLHLFTVQEKYRYITQNTNASIPNIYNRKETRLSPREFKERNEGGATSYFGDFDKFRGLVLLFRYTRTGDKVYYKYFPFQYLDKSKNAFVDHPSQFLEQLVSHNNKEEFKLLEMDSEISSYAQNAGIEGFYNWTQNMSNIYMVFIDFQELYDSFPVEKLSYDILSSNRNTLIQKILKKILLILKQYLFNNMPLIDDSNIEI